MRVYSVQTQAKVIAAIIALGGFVVALLSGMRAGNPAHLVLFDALVALLVCQLLGIAVGAVATRVILDHVEQHKSQHPIPEIALESASSTSSTPNAKAFAENV